MPGVATDFVGVLIERKDGSKSHVYCVDCILALGKELDDKEFYAWWHGRYQVKGTARAAHCWWGCVANDK